MAKMTRKEALSKLRLLNRDPAFVMYVNPSNTSAIYIDVDPSTLILGDTYLGNVFEWVDPDHKQLKVLGDTDADAFVIDVKPRTNMDPTITHVKIDGPNSSVLKKTNELPRNKTLIGPSCSCSSLLNCSELLGELLLSSLLLEFVLLELAPQPARKNIESNPVMIFLTILFIK